MAEATCISIPVDTDRNTPQPAEWSSPEFGAIYREHAQPIYYLALRILGEPAEAQDATHDVFLKAFQNLRGFRAESGLRTWLYRIAINHCQNLRKTWHRRTMVNNLEPAFWDTATARTESPLRAAEGAELGIRIQRALEQLPEEYRLLLLLVADEELSYEQIGELTSQSADAVRGKLHRARKAFAAHFHPTA
ncbi:MAG: RNA polymerase sigma factor [Chthoniobacteraceae bacterium]